MSYALRYACSQPVTACKYLNPLAVVGVGLRYALTAGGSLAESYVATGGYMRSEPSLEVSDTIVIMIPALVTRGGGYAITVQPDQVDAGMFERLAAAGQGALERGDVATATARFREAPRNGVPGDRSSTPRPARAGAGSGLASRGAIRGLRAYVQARGVR